MSCYCGSGELFEVCCQLRHLVHERADTAESLMRARYSAYVLGMTEFLNRTWLDGDGVESAADLKVVNWCGLDIVSTRAGMKSDSEGWVEFKAYFIEHDRLFCLHENSHFVQNQGHWFYKEGELYRHEPKELALNAECPCGSGKKYKRCCRRQL
ncbi:MAG: YchJ family metal-binding protein [Gammaproteobacteria bacterium]|nr:YchJ family metal-binding protein [Gammaproteobacteria bacterium]